MFLFKLSTGKCILHTGDFRASQYMEEHPIFWNNEIDTIYLDTTYLSKHYEFYTQNECIDQIIDMAKIFMNECAGTSTKPLIICGAYKVGKERIWIRLAQELKVKVWISDERRRVVNCMQCPHTEKRLTRDAKDATIHILTLGHVRYPVRRIQQKNNRFKQGRSFIFSLFLLFY